VLKAESSGKSRHELVLEVCDTPKVLVDVGVSPLNIVIKAKTIGKIFFDHGLTQRQIEKIPAMLEKPQQIYMSASHADSVVVFVYENHAGAPIMIPLARDRRIGRAVVNEVVSMYAKTGPDPRPRWTRQGYLLWEDAPEKQRPRLARHFGFDCLVWDARRGRSEGCLNLGRLSRLDGLRTELRSIWPGSSGRNRNAFTITDGTRQARAHRLMPMPRRRRPTVCGQA
jgi:hypothetical protein